MGTRALVKFIEDKKTLVTLYRQYDGYPTGLGQDLLNSLNKGKVTITNGYGSKDTSPAAFNGIGCLAAYLVGVLKHRLDRPNEKGNSIGNVYLMPANTKNVGEEFIYTLSTIDGKLFIEINGYGKVIYNGLLSEMDPKVVEAKT